MPHFQIASDLHLEFYDSKTRGPDFFATLVDPSTGADYLLLAGDIGYPEKHITKEFFKWCCGIWSKVFWVYGNHEYYSIEKEKVNKFNKRKIITMENKEYLGNFYDLPNLHILSDTLFELPGTDITILGSTLWTHTPADADISNYSDFKCIYTEFDTLLSPDYMNVLHQESLAFVQEELNACVAKGRRAVVITHHLPSYTMIQDRYQGHPLNFAFASHSDSLLHVPAVALWACGHSHGYMQEGKCVLNARGYPGEVCVREYNSGFVVHI